MLIESLNSIFSSDNKNVCTEERQVITAPDVMVEKAEVEKEDVPTTNDRDIDALEERFGTMNSGMIITMSLHEALSLLPRDRKRSDAYKGLKAKLSRVYGVTLFIGEENKKRQRKEGNTLETSKKEFIQL